MHVLALELHLTSTQKTRITAIEDRARSRRAAAFAPGGTPNPQSMRAGFQKMLALDQSASAQIDAVLTGSQRKMLGGLLKSIGAARMVGIPMDIYADLSLTPNQTSRIEALAASNRTAMRGIFERGPAGGFDTMRRTMETLRAKTDAKLKTVLTARQSALIAKYRRQHPRPRFGGPMGGGPQPGPGGPMNGMPPPPGGEFGGPPPGGPPPGGPGTGQ